ncbi:MAG TPA: bifunctional class I SAM-dependent methyltransferase/glycosyltransferase family 2 protein [Candidatus Omnitrophota bacterium]|nr:bifunctional class I SAM-dependent methyltransferase/glycosyltransferase family 2 protein [Candidatus Omnitrophota bacterium]
MQATDLVKDHFDELAPQYDMYKRKNRYYYDNIKTFIQKSVQPKCRVLEIGCGTGEILAVTQASYGVGIDISREMVKIAQKKFPGLHFIHSSVEDFESDEKFDFIIMTDLIHHVYDVMTVFEKIYRFCHPQTRVIVTYVNPWWDPLYKLAEKCGWKAPDVPLNYLDMRNIGKILELVDFKINQTGYLLSSPIFIPLLSYLANSLGVRLWGFNKLSFVSYMLIQPTAKNTMDLGLGCSVVIPCYNEEGNIVGAIKRIPKMGKYTEIIVVNDGSRDKTAALVKDMQHEYPNLRLIDYSPNHGKGYAVKSGFDAATQEVIMILDADMTVEPEELPRFFDPLNKGLCQFVNGTRMVYPKEGQSMRFLNQLGNKLFSLLMSFLTNQALTDTLCGTKALYKKDYQYIQMGLDKWGDFDLIFGAAKMGNKILEVPVHYKNRRAGESKMKAFKHGLHLLKACARGFRELVFVPARVNKNS